MSELQTDRLCLRKWTASDADPWSKLCADPSFWRYPLGRAVGRAESAGLLTKFARHWDEHGFGLWAAIERERGVLIGFIGLAVPTFLPEVLPAVEIGWRLGTEWRGQGLASEGGRAAMAFGFEELSLGRIVSIAEPANTASLRVARRLGMTFDRATRHPALGVPLVVTSIDRARWRAGAGVQRP